MKLGLKKRGMRKIPLPVEERGNKERGIAMNELDRYERQERIWGKGGQEKLARATVTIVGDGNCAKYTAMPLVALGIGHVRILGAGEPRDKEWFMDVPLQGEPRVQGYERTLQLLNPKVTTIGIPIDLETRLGLDFLHGSTVMVDATNNPRSKALVLEYAQQHKVPVLTSGVAESYAKLMMWHPGDQVEAAHLMPNFAGKEQNPLIALLWGGLMAEEVKKFVLGGAETLRREAHYRQGDRSLLSKRDGLFNLLERLKSYFTRKLNYSTNSGDRERFSFQRLEESPIPFDHAPYQDKSVLVVGAGALGNIMAMALATMGFGTVDYLDYDTIESTNLNRQVLFYDSVGLPKAAVLAAKHAKMNPKARVRGLVQKLEVQDGVFTPDVLREEGYDLGLDLVDNLYTRAVLAAYAVLRDMPLVTAASSPTAAEVAVYVPGVTACLNHIFSDYYEKGRREEVIRRQSCIQQPDPSVIVTNQVAAALAALEICGIFDAERYGNPHNGILKYSTELEPRLGQITVKDVCECYRRKKDIPDMEIKEMKEAAHGR